MDKAKRKRIKRYLIWAALAALVALLTVMPLLAKQEAEQDGPVASVLSAQAEASAIKTYLHGGGTLKAQGAQDVKLPTDVKITEFLVKNGDYVKEGTPLALVDKVSVMHAITQVDETLKFLREELEDARDEKVDSTISAVAGGRVKKIFAQEGESVQEVMLRDGALAILSIDGLMALKIENDVPLTTGEAVVLAFPDGTEAGGRVESSLDGVKIITVEDQGYAIGEGVLVTTLEGESVGSGNLYIHNAWKATGHTGTISRVHVKEEAKLSSGATLFTLEDREYTAQLQHRANQHREYEAQLQKLLQMYESGTIDAPCDGVISGADQDSPHLLEEQKQTWSADELASNDKGYRIILLSSAKAGCTEKEDCEAKAGEHTPDCPMECTRVEGCPAKAGKHYSDCVTFCVKAQRGKSCTAGNHYKDCIGSCDNCVQENTCKGSSDPQYHYATCIESCDKEKGTACPATRMHKKDCIMRCGHADVETGCDATGEHHSDCIKSCDGTLNCPASKHYATCELNGMTFTAIAAKVDADGGTTHLVTRASSVIYNVQRNGAGWQVVGGRVDEKLMVNSLTIPANNASAFKKGDIVLWVTGTHADGRTQDMGVHKIGASVGMPNFNFNFNFNIAGMIGGFAGYGNYAGAMPQTQDEGLYNLDGSTLMTVTPVGSMTLEIALDEQDIAKAELDMAAEVQVAAIKGKTYPAWITKVGDQGSNSGGSSKYIVEVTMDAAMEMLSGMSATARIPLETYENVLSIPVAALVEQGGKTLVYTALAEDTQEPGNPVEVETGVSDGEYVQILSGLNPGDTVYYSYYDTLELDTSAEAERFTFG